jgi:hypothetical protein
MRFIKAAYLHSLHITNNLSDTAFRVQINYVPTYQHQNSKTVNTYEPSLQNAPTLPQFQSFEILIIIIMFLLLLSSSPLVTGLFSLVLLLNQR